MKNRLLAVMALCGATSSTLPLWAAWESPELQFVEPNLATDGTGGGAYYVYHVATQKFMANGEPYGTRLVVSDDGQEVTLNYGEDYELNRRPESDPEYSTAKGWRLSMMNAPSNGGYHELFIAGGGVDIYVDHNKTGHILWKIVPQGNSTYKIKVIDEDKLYGVEANSALYANSYIAVSEGKTTVDPLVDKSTAGYENAGDEWKFVTPAVYEAFRAKKKLSDQLNKADEVSFTDYQKYADIYNNVNATVEEVEVATEELKQAITNWLASKATPDNPIDYTNVITNNAFTDGTNGWDNGGYGVQNDVRETNVGEYYKMDGYAESWTGWGGKQDDKSISQVLENMPIGKYRLSALTIGYQQQDKTITPTGVYLYAENSGLESRAEAHTLEFGGLINGNSADIEPQPRNTVLEFFAMDPTIKIGFKTVSTNCNWIAVDNFKLEYLGLVEGGMAEELKKVITQAEDLKNTYDTQNMRYSAAGEEKFNQLVATVKQAAGNPEVDEKTLGDMLTSLQQGMAELKADVNAYNVLSGKGDELYQKWDESPYVELEFPEYEKYVEGLNDAYQNRTFDPAELDSIQPRADKIFRESVLKALADGATSDVTGFMKNPNFTGSKEGWKGTNFAHNYDIGEVYMSTFDVYQELEGLPDGTYEITMQGFYRPAGNSDCAAAWGLEGTLNDVLAYAYGNEASAKLPHVFDYPLDENVANNCEQLTTGGPDLEGKWVCNGMASASEFFAADEYNYQVKLKCYVGDDGKLRVGVKLPVAPESNGYWTTFDNFKVNYLGADDMTGATSTINALIDQASDLLNDEDVLTTTEAREGLRTAIETANKVVSEGLTLEAYKEQSALLGAAIEKGQAAQRAVSKFETFIMDHLRKFEIGVYDNYAGTEEYTAFSSLVWDEMEPALTADLESMAWIEDATLKVNKAYVGMLSSGVDYSTASKNEPVEVTSLIINPSFNTQTVDELGATIDVKSSDGWTVESLKGGTDVKDAMVFEIYNDSSEVYQKLYNVPVGYYRVVMNGFYRAGDAIEAGVARRDGEESLNAELFVKSGEGKWSEKLPSIFEHVSELKYDGSDKVLPDSLFPESNMLYHFIVDQPAGAKLAFEDGEYECDTYFYVGEGEEPVLGVRKTAMLTNDWSCFDNFRLYYYGDGDANRPDDFVDGIDGVAADGAAAVVSSVWYTINGVRVDEPKQRGIYIRQDMMSDGTKKAVKVLVK